MTLLSPLQRPAAAAPRVQMVRHELKRRSLQVNSVERLTPAMLRIGLSGQDLCDFDSLAFDDHVKVFAPTASGGIERRDYTPRRFDRKSCTLVLDFAVHDAGPATRWALDARPGDRLEIGGPRGSKVIASEDVPRWLLIGDETALPAIGRHIEAARPGVQVTSLAAVAGPEEQQAFESAAELTVLWAHRPPSAAADPAALLSVVETLDLEPETFVWIAAEAGVARAIRNHFVEARSHQVGWMKAAGYWVLGQADVHEPIP